MTVTLLDAAAAYAARETAVGDATVISPTQARRLYVGLDLDVHELLMVANAEAELALRLLALTGDTLTMMQSLYAAGVATGLLLADMRARENAQTAAAKGA